MTRCLTALALVLAALPARAEEYRDCVIEPAMVVEIGAAVEGVIEKIEVRRGDILRKGDPIAWLNAEVERESLKIAERLAASDLEIQLGHARLELAQKQFDRASELVERNAGTVADRDIAEAALKSARLELAQAEEDHRMAQLELARTRAVVERRIVRAPMDGVLLRRLIGPGEFVHSQAQIAQIAAVDPLYVDVFLPIEIYNEVSVGQSVTLRPGAPIGGVYEARITAIDNVFDAASDTFGMRLELANPDNLLPAGVDCTITLDIG